MIALGGGGGACRYSTLLALYSLVKVVALMVNPPEYYVINFEKSQLHEGEVQLLSSSSSLNGARSSAYYKVERRERKQRVRWMEH